MMLILSFNQGDGPSIWNSNGTMNFEKASVNYNYYCILTSFSCQIDVE